MALWFRWLGVLLGAISLFSLSQKLWNFGISSVFSDILSFYRTLFHPAAELIISGLRWVLASISVKLPNIPADAVVIYMLFCAAASRTAIRQFTDDELAEKPNSGAVVVLYVLAFIYIMVIFPILAMATLIALFFRKNAEVNKLNIRYISTWMAELLRVVTAFAILFAWNYYST